MSWGNYDKIQFEIDCKFKPWNKGSDKHALTPFGPNYFDAQKWFQWKNHLDQTPSVETALGMLDMEFEGDPHRADADAYNVGRMLKFL